MTTVLRKYDASRASADRVKARCPQGHLCVIATLVPPDTPPARLEALLADLHRQTGADLAIFSSDGAVVARAGRALPPPRFDRRVRHHEPERVGGPGGPTWAVALADGRRVVARLPIEHRGGWWRPIAVLAAVALAVAAVALPVVRRITRRLERLRAGVERLGAGDLKARAEVRGRDEVAALAASFNGAAERIERLVLAQKMLLANVSHELRTPLARLRLGIEMLGATEATRLEGLRQDVAELDAMIDEILTASRLDSVATELRREEVDLLALAVEEAARYDVAVAGEPVLFQGDPVLLRRLIRNLLDNARRHGGAGEISVEVRRNADSARLEVSDSGPGIPETERERIFEPFYRLAGAAGTGSGLGLALVRQIARRHGGDAHCLARFQGGSTFRVDLPA
jgi:signal transduction histidine kinase